MYNVKAGQCHLLMLCWPVNRKASSECLVYIDFVLVKCTCTVISTISSVSLRNITLINCQSRTMKQIHRNEIKTNTSVTTLFTEKAIQFKSNFTDTQHQNNRQNQGYF